MRFTIITGNKVNDGAHKLVSSQIRLKVDYEVEPRRGALYHFVKPKPRSHALY